MIYVAGVDVGAGTAKAVILGDCEIVSYSVMPVRSEVANLAKLVTEEALNKAGLSLHRLNYVVATGYGREAVSFANLLKTEIICQARGVNFLTQEARTVIDIGAQDSKIIAVRQGGSVTNFCMNDKCAAGTGRFLEVMARALGTELDEMGSISLGSKDPCPISSTCTVFAESEVVTLRAKGNSVEDLLAGIHKAIATRIAAMGVAIGFSKEVVFTGGVAKNTGVKKALETAIDVKIITPVEPQITAALGAALIAETQFRSIGSKEF